MSRRGAYNAQLRKENIPTIESFCRDLGLTWRFVNGDWHIRIENVLDVYPTRQRYCWLPDQEWGFYGDYDDLGRIFTKHMEANNE